MQLGVIGLGTMGANLARNAARNGAKVVLYNRTTEKTVAFMKDFGSEGEFVDCPTLADLVQALEPPRPILLMVKAGAPVDAVISELTPLLKKDDIIIDAGNSHYSDTERRAECCKQNAVRFIGMGVSGGEQGALLGPSMMPGGDKDAYLSVEPLFSSMAATVGDKPFDSAQDKLIAASDKQNRCIAYMGPGGAGHFVKMVHNGIEYGMMQLIAESYDLLKSVAGKSNAELAEIYGQWNSGDLESFLLEITAKIFTVQDDGKDLIDLIKDAAGQKGTGKWTTEAAMTAGITIPTINAAVDARILSGDTCLRNKLRDVPWETSKSKIAAEDVRSALTLSVLCAYLQGLELIRATNEEQQWGIDMSEVCRIWRGGCIIRSSVLELFQRLFAGDTSAIQELYQKFAGDAQKAWRRTIVAGVQNGVPLPSMSASLAYYDAYRRERLPQNLIQAQRDFFGAHTYERVDKKGSFHTDWQ